MKAIVYSKYGSPDVLRLVDVAKPVPRDRELLIRTRATTVTSGDWRARSLAVPPGFGLLARLMFGFTKPRQPILGTELAGEVESVGKNVTTFRTGDPVFAYRGAGMGCHAEYLCMPESGPVVKKPENLTWEEAAAMSFGGTTALVFLRRGKVQRHERVLINGASGGVGTAAIQLARYFGADVTGVCSGANAELVRSLGAAHVIDYTREDFTAQGDTYDVVMDTVGTASYARSKASLQEQGRLLLVYAGLGDMLRAPWVSMLGRRRILAGPVSGNAEDLRFLAARAEAGDFKPVIDRCYPYEQAVEAHRYVDTGHKRGNVIITF